MLKGSRGSSCQVTKGNEHKETGSNRETYNDTIDPFASTAWDTGWRILLPRPPAGCQPGISLGGCLNPCIRLYPDTCRAGILVLSWQQTRNSHGRRWQPI